MDNLSESKIHKLRELTKELPALPTLGNHRVNNISSPLKLIRYDMGEGIIGWGYPLYKTPEMAVQRVFMPKGSVFPQHIHKVTEWVITINGCYELQDCPQAGKKFKGKDIAIFEPGEPHGGIILADTWILCITIPADMEGYPDAP